MRWWWWLPNQLPMSACLQLSPEKVHVPIWSQLCLIYPKSVGDLTIHDSDWGYVGSNKETDESICRVLWCYSEVKASVPWASNKWGSEWVSEYAIFLHGLAQQLRPQKKWNLAQRYPSGEDDAGTLNTSIAQRNCVMSHSVLKIGCSLHSAPTNRQRYDQRYIARLI